MGNGSVMPSHVRIFWWLSVTIVAYWIFSTAWHLTFPPAHHFDYLAKLPAQLRKSSRRIELWTPIVQALVLTSVTLGLASLATFRHLNWARWAFAIVFLTLEAMPFLISAAYQQLDVYLASLSHENWADPWGYVSPILTLVAIALVFSGNARDWFRSPRVIA